ncbi:MAG: hypothetical protein AAF483_16600 [Planctomycetota bacterium]
MKLTNTQLRIAKVYGLVAILLAISMLSFAICEAAGVLVRPFDFTAVCFTASVFMSIPFVVTYTILGLNTAEGQKKSLETKQRHEFLRSACPWWHPMWYACTGVVLVSLVVSAVYQLPLDILLICNSMLLMPTGIWFLTVFERAAVLFLEQTDDSDGSGE